MEKEKSGHFFNTFSLISLFGLLSCLQANAAGSLIGDLSGLRNDSPDQVRAIGWVCLTGNDTPASVTLFAGDPVLGEAEIATVVANEPSKNPSIAQAVAKACGNDRPHAFSLPISVENLRRYAGRPLVVNARAQTLRKVLSKPKLRIPSGAGSAPNVAGLEGFNLLVDCSINGAFNCATGLNLPMTGAGGAPAYAYAAAIVNTDRKFHMFFCSVGMNNGWDSIRYSSSEDGKHWSTPVIKLSTIGSAEQDLSACDPAVIFFRGYYYLFYGSNYRSPNGNRGVIRVARSLQIDGAYSVLAKSGKWGATQNDPPAKLIEPAKDIEGYGAGQPTLVVSGDRLLMWYTDISYDYPHGNIMFVQSSDGTKWSNPILTDAHTVNVDVKWSLKQKKFIMFSVGPVGHEMVVQTRSSENGINWSSPQLLPNLRNNPFSFCAQNIGVSSNQDGNLSDERLLVSYMAPFVSQLTTSAGKDLTCKLTRPQWNLYGAFAPSP